MKNFQQWLPHCTSADSPSYILWSTNFTLHFPAPKYVNLTCPPSNRDGSPQPSRFMSYCLETPPSSQTILIVSGMRTLSQKVELFSLRRFVSSETGTKMPGLASGGRPETSVIVISWVLILNQTKSASRDSEQPATSRTKNRKLAVNFAICRVGLSTIMPLSVRILSNHEPHPL